MPNFPIVDSHVHLFDVNVLNYDWLDAAPKINKTHGLSEYDKARGAVDVESIVFAEVDVAAGQHIDEAKWVEALAIEDQRIRGMVAHAPLTKGAAVEEDLHQLMECNTVRGIRYLMQNELDQSFCLEPDFIAGVKLLEKHDWSFDICVKHWGMGFAIELVKRCPDVRFVLDHIGKPGIKHDMWEPWKNQISQLAEFPNVTCKVSGVITEADHGAWSPRQIKPYVQHALDCFGFKRCMFGSDWPVSVLTHEYPDWVTLLDEILVGTSEDEQRDFYCETAKRVYRL